MKKVSVVIPVYNAAQYIERCVKSIADNKCVEEIILVNDGSKDNSLAVCKQLADQDNRIRIIDQPNGGASAARNKGMSHINGQYVIFVDADDTMCPLAIDHMYEAAARNSFPDTVHGSLRRISRLDETTEEKHTTALITDRRILAKVLLEKGINLLFYSPCAKLFKKDFLKQNEILFPLNQPLEEDTVFNCQVYKHCNSVYFLEEIVYNYICNSASATGTFQGLKGKESALAVNNAIRNLYRVLGAEKKDFSRLDELTSYRILFLIYSIYRSGKLPLRQRLHWLKEYDSIGEIQKTDWHKNIKGLVPGITGKLAAQKQWLLLDVFMKTVWWANRAKKQLKKAVKAE